MSSQKKRGRPRILEHGRQVVSFSLDPADCDWVDALVREMKASGRKEVTRSLVMRLAIRLMVDEYKGLEDHVVIARLMGGSYDPAPNILLPRKDPR